jgi:hypothetical protein
MADADVIDNGDCTGSKVIDGSDMGGHKRKVCYPQWLEVITTVASYLHASDSHSITYGMVSAIDLRSS